MPQALCTADLDGRATMPAPQNRGEKCRCVPTSAPRDGRQCFFCSSTPPAPPQTRETVGNPSLASCFSGRYVFLAVGGFKSAQAGLLAPHFGIPEVLKQADRHSPSSVRNEERQLSSGALRRTGVQLPSLKVSCWIIPNWLQTGNRVFQCEAQCFGEIRKSPKTAAARRQLANM